MTVLGKFTKQPVEVLDYQFDFTDWLADRADNITGTPPVVASVLSGTSTTPLTISGIATASGIVRFFASGGTNGCKYEISCTITTAGGRVKQEEMVLTIKET